MKWDTLGMERRRELLRMADLWDGNTYAAQEWECLPKHIQNNLTEAWEMSCPTCGKDYCHCLRDDPRGQA